MKFLKKIVKRLEGFECVNVGEIVDNRYLGWPKPKKKQMYVALNDSTGEIDWTYKLDKETLSWSKINPDGIECEMETSLRKVPLTYNITFTKKGFDEGDGEEVALAVEPTDSDNSYSEGETKGVFSQYTLDTDTANITIKGVQETYTITKIERNNETMTLEKMDDFQDTIDTNIEYTMTVTKNEEENSEEESTE